MGFINKNEHPDYQDFTITLSNPAKKSVYIFIAFILLVLAVLLFLIFNGYITSFFVSESIDFFRSYNDISFYHDDEYCEECAGETSVELMYRLPKMIFLFGVPFVLTIFPLIIIIVEVTKKKSFSNIIQNRAAMIIKALAWIILWINYYVLITVPVMIILYKKMNAKIIDCSTGQT